MKKLVRLHIFHHFYTLITNLVHLILLAVLYSMHSRISIALLLSAGVAVWDGQATIIDLHKDSHIPVDIRPRVWVRFLKHGNEGIRHSMVFDTGSSRSYVPCLDEEVCSRRGERRPVGYYIHEPDAPTTGGPRTLHFGLESCCISVQIRAVVPQLAEIVGVRDRRSFEHEIHLCINSGELGPAGALLGAGKSSAFANDSGIFTLIPPDLRDISTLGPTESMGMLLVGERDEAVLGLNCAPDSTIKWTPAMVGTGANGVWYVPGSVSVGGGREDVTWMVDTGARGIYMPRSAYEYLMSTIKEAGSAVGDFIPRDGLTPITNCLDSTTRFPTITISVGSRLDDGGSGFVIDILPSDYISDASPDGATCVSRIDPSILPRRPNVYVIGMGTMRKTVTVFDAAKSRVGFCHLRRARPPHSLMSPISPFASRPPSRSPLCGGGDMTWLSAKMNSAEQKQWVPGSAIVRLAGARVVMNDALWLIDQRAEGIHVPNQLFEAINQLVADGCPTDYLEAFPKLLFRLGDVSSNEGGEFVGIHVSPAQYIEKYGEGQCRSTLIPVIPPNNINAAVVPLGPDVLGGRVVISDSLNGRVGFCASLKPDGGRAIFAQVPFPSGSLAIALSPATAAVGGAPSVSVEFKEQNLNTIYSLRLNTAISNPRMRFGGNGLAKRFPPRRDAAPGEGYVDTGAVRVPAESSLDGFMQRVEETMIFAGRRGLDHSTGLRIRVHMDIVDPGQNEGEPTNLNQLAADRSSQFAIATKVFALIPNPSGSAAKNRFRILVGDRDDARLSEKCRSGDPLAWLLLAPGKDWLVSGSVGIAGGSRRPVNTNFIIASAFDRVELPESVYSDLTDEIASLAGGEYVHGSQGVPGVIPRCNDALIAKLPSVSISVKWGVKVDLQGPDYVFRVDGVTGDNECYSRLVRAEGPDRPDKTYSLGFPFLNKVVAVFDNEFNRIGFCPARIPL